MDSDTPRHIRSPACAALITMSLCVGWVGAQTMDAPAVPGGPVIVSPVNGPVRGPVPAGRIEAWVVLAMPGAVSMPSRDSGDRRQHQVTISAHQTSLLQDLTALGAQERGRQSLTRSAVLVEVDEAMLDRIARLPGVARVQKVTHLHSTDGQRAPPRIGTLPASR